MHVPASTPTTSPLRILIVDADRRVRDSLTDLIRCETQLETIAAVGSPAAAVEAVERWTPDVVVIDPRLPDVDDGLGLLQRLRHDAPSTRILVMSWSTALENADLAAMADVLLDKSTAPEMLVAAIEDAMHRHG
jgi:DNA-binding NarL/FixJ family response regulator